MISENKVGFASDPSFSEYETRISDVKVKEVLYHWLGEIQKVPDQDSQVVREALNWLRLLFEQAADGVDVFKIHGKAMSDLTEIIQRLQEGNIAGAEEMLFDKPNERRE